jgi:effector-binding domain-containing protein
MDINDTLSTMSFVMPSDYNEQNLPKPLDSEVLIQTTSEEYVAPIRFGGFASEKEINNYSEKLKKLLAEKQIKTIGNLRYLGYNLPYQLVGRRNEIIVSIEWKN